MNTAQLIDEYEKCGQKVRMATAGLTPAQLKAFPVPGTWSIQQIVIHILDCELIGADRMKRIIAMDNPLLPAFDENKFIQRLFYEDQSVEEAVSLLDLQARHMGRILRRLPQATFTKTGMHTEAGPVSVAQVLEKMVTHTEHHLKFAQDKRKMLEKGIQPSL